MALSLFLIFTAVAVLIDNERNKILIPIALGILFDEIEIVIIKNTTKVAEQRASETISVEVTTQLGISGLFLNRGSLA